jgi:hypothetical protein
LHAVAFPDGHQPTINADSAFIVGSTTGRVTRGLGNIPLV